MLTHKHFRAALDVLLSQEDGKFYAHCLQFDLLAEGTTKQQARKRLAEMVFEYIRFFIEKNMEQFMLRPAPMKYWEVLKMVKKVGHFIPQLPEGLLRATSPNRISAYLSMVDVPACA